MGPMGGMPEGPMPQEPPMDMPPAGGGQSEFDTNFDAGVEADEDSDPKKYIQQLTGKLSQTLSTYNNENGGSDTETNKYVANMLVAQVAKNLDDAERKEVIKKINTTPEANDNAESPEEMPEDEPMEQPEEEGGEQPMMEGVFQVVNKRQIKEALNNEVFNTATSDDEVYSKNSKKKKKKRNPFDGKRIN